MVNFALNNKDMMGTLSPEELIERKNFTKFKIMDLLGTSFDDLCKKLLSIFEYKHYIIDEKTAPTVQKIFEMYSNGNTVTEIINYLNSLNLRTSRGTAFNKNSLNRILQNKKYIGTYVYKDMEIENGIPRIISDELFYKVQGIMNTNKKAPARAKAKQEYILTTKLFCGHCKEMMRGYGGTSKSGTTYYYYACNGKIKKVCNKKIIKKDYMENLVIEICRKQLTDKNIDKIAHEVLAYCEKNKENENLKFIIKQLKITNVK